MATIPSSGSSVFSGTATSKQTIDSVIFLNISGVLFDNCQDGSVYKKAKELFPQLNERQMSSYHLDRAATHLFNVTAISNLDALLKKVKNSAIVLCSNWASKRTVEQLQEIFQIHAFSRSIIDKVQEYDDYKSLLKGRAKEIAFWLEKHPECKHFVILDDYDEWLEQGFPHNYVEIDIRKLLTQDDVQKAETILSQP